MIPVGRDIPLNNFHTVPPPWLEALDLASGQQGHDRVMRRLLGLLFTVSIEQPGKWISYSRRNEWWTDAAYFCGSDFTRASICRAVELLERKGYIEHQKAQPMPNGSGMQSRIRPSGMLLERFSSVSLGAPVFCGPVLMMRDENKKPMLLRRSNETDRMARQVEAINADIAGIRIEHPGMVMRPGGYIAEIGGALINTSDRRLRRIFNNGSLSMGGRAYASSWQNIPKKLRPALRVNGEAICEPDHQYLHPRLLYAEKGMVWPLTDDAYDVADWPRELVKPAFNTMINADSERAALMSICRLIAKAEGADDPRVTQLVRDTYAEEGWVCGPSWQELARLFGEDASDLMDAIRRRHRPVAEFFCSGIGLRLQRRDADMCLSVTRKLLDQGIPTLPVHDSHIAPKRYESDLKMAMSDAIDRVISKATKFAVKSVTFQLLNSYRNPHNGGGSVGAVVGVAVGPAPSSALGPDSPPASAIPGIEPAGLFLGEQHFPEFEDHLHGLFPIDCQSDLGCFTEGMLPTTVRAAAIHEAKARGITQERLAKRIGISRPQLTNALRGRFGLGKQAAGKLREFLSC